MRNKYLIFDLHNMGRRLLWLLVCLIALLCIAPPIVMGMTQVDASAKEDNLIIIDAGHGGVDPGAIGINGLKEKDVNLDIAITLRDMLTTSGYRVLMTRETDIAVHDPKYTTIHSIKSSDLNNRLKLMREFPQAPVILIHQNEYVYESSRGAQMFYGRYNEKSKELAEALRVAFVEKLQPDNRRGCKKSTSAVYVLHNAPNPIVLAECGFLSNSIEAELLLDQEYRQKVAFTLYCGIMEYSKG